MTQGQDALVLLKFVNENHRQLPLNFNTYIIGLSVTIYTHWGLIVTIFTHAFPQSNAVTDIAACHLDKLRLQQRTIDGAACYVNVLARIGKMH